MRVLIVGCGWLGLAVARRLLRAGHDVIGIRRRRRGEDELTDAGVTPLFVDLAEPGAAELLPRDVDAIVACQAAAGRTTEAYERAYLRVNDALLRYAVDRQVRRFVYTGSTGVFGQRDGEAVDESTPVAPTSASGRVLADAERRILDAPAELSTCIVRLSGLYGPGRFGIVDRVRRGRLGLGPGETAWMNFCHLEDAVGTVVAALGGGRSRAVYHASDAEPARRRDVVRWIADRIGITPMQTREPAEVRSNRRVVADLTRQELDLELVYPTFRDGLSWLERSA